MSQSGQSLVSGGQHIPVLLNEIVSAIDVALGNLKAREPQLKTDVKMAQAEA